MHADFCIVATGMYSSEHPGPTLPLAENYVSFKGDIRHSSAFTDRKAAAGKHVLVVGGGKSAIDCAVAAAKEGKTCTLVTRQMHWPVPRHLLNLVPFKWGTYSRFGSFMLDAHHEQTPVGQCFHGALVPVKRAWWRVVEVMFRGQFRLPSDMVPAIRIEHDLFNGGQVLSYEFRDMLRNGQIKLVVGEIDRFHETGAVLKDGTDLACEMLIYGTGFRKNYGIFEKTLLEDGSLDMEKDGLYLYRNIIPPKLPNLAFIGSEVSTFNNILSQGLQMVWLARILTGQLVLPKVDAMEESLARDKTWKRSWMPASKVRAATWQLHMMKYHDTLLRDMGENHLRKGFNVLAEVLAPYNASDYAELFQ
ncbi:unnamed protein product [Polarella glacialis]|uniref:Flavin-containing monooxygenase n=1 Tax=Polarella glacialis TaxID=89957 RepID=A0A813H784_POLGL|nr:unnamed protein product [Polarella glacialis]